MFAKITSAALRFEDDAVFNILLALATALLMLQLLSLYTTPVPDSYLWWGDESWLMLEFRTQILEGIFRHPYALGATLEHGSGFLFGNMWVTALLYGAPAALLKNGADIILIGRTVTALLGLTLLAVLFEVIRRLTSNRLFAMFGVTLLLTSRSFLLTSHSARYDILTALVIVGGLYFLIHSRETKPNWITALEGFGITAMLLITVHVPIALWGAGLVSIVFRAKEKRVATAGVWLMGSCCCIAVLVGISALRGQSSIFGSSSPTAFLLNVRDIPALRPWSRSVQWSNLLQKCHTFRVLGLGYIVMLGALGAVIFARRITRMSNPPEAELHSVRRGFFLTIFLMIVASWIEFESSAPTSYLIYILPVLSVGIALTAWLVLPVTGRNWIVLATGIILCFYGFRDAPWPRGAGYHTASANDRAVNEALAQVNHSVDNPRPLLLAFNPAVHDILRDSTVSLMTTHFVEFPANPSESPEHTIRKEHVAYILLYRSALKPDYMREVGPIDQVVRNLGTLLWQQTGVFTDIGRSYWNPGTMSDTAQDTIQLYRLYE